MKDLFMIIHGNEVLYQGEIPEDCASPKCTSPDERVGFTHYHFSYDNGLSISVSQWINDRYCKPGMFRQIQFQEENFYLEEKALQGLLVLLQSVTQITPNSPPTQTP